MVWNVDVKRPNSGGTGVVPVVLGSLVCSGYWLENESGIVKKGAAKLTSVAN